MAPRVGRMVAAATVVIAIVVGICGDDEATASPAFDLSGAGPALWTRDGVQVGTSAIYDRRTRAWSVVR